MGNKFKQLVFEGRVIGLEMMMMTIRKRVLTAILCVVCLRGAAWAEVRIPAFTAYVDPDVSGARVSESGGITGWRDPGLTVTWFGRIQVPGAIHCGVELTLDKGLTSDLALTVAGERRTRQVQGLGDETTLTADFGSFAIASAGYQAFRLAAFNPPGQNNGSIKTLVLEGPATESVHFNLKPRRNAASVHIRYPVPKGTKVAAFYCEVTGLEDPVWTYYMACGWHRGYFGMQVNSPTQRRIIFSVWDSGNEAVDRDKVAAPNRVTLVAKGEGVYTGDFGNEGTGGHSHLVFPWKTGQIQRFLVTAQPVDETFTIFSGYYFRPDQEKWMLISSWKAPQEGGYLRGLYSFSENFGGANGHLLRKALYGNQWIRTDQGRWIELTEATFSHDVTGRADRYDRFMGLEQGQFFLSHGGFVPGTAAYGEAFVRTPTTHEPNDINLP